MTSRHFVPNLDRQITKIVSTPGTLNPLGQPTMGTTTETTVWAMRRDFSGRDFAQGFEGGLITLATRRYIVRAESGPWAARDTIRDEDGNTLVVQGVQQIQRQYLELLVQGT